VQCSAIAGISRFERCFGCKFLLLLSLSRPVPTKLFSCPRKEIVIPPRSEDAQPQDEFRTIYNHTNHIELRLEQDRDKRRKIARGIDPDEDERYSAYGAMLVYVPVMSQYTCSQEDSG